MEQTLFELLDGFIEAEWNEGTRTVGQFRKKIVEQHHDKITDVKDELARIGLTSIITTKLKEMRKSGNLVSNEGLQLELPGFEGTEVVYGHKGERKALALCTWIDLEAAYGKVHQSWLNIGSAHSNWERLLESVQETMEPNPAMELKDAVKAKG